MERAFGAGPHTKCGGLSTAAAKCAASGRDDEILVGVGKNEQRQKHVPFRDANQKDGQNLWGWPLEWVSL
jgi:hypothetical protein